MRLVAVRDLQPGMTVARDVSDGVPGRLPLVRRGAKLGPSYVPALERSGVRAVWIEDEWGEGIEPAAPLHPETRRAAEEHTARAFTEARACLERGRTLSDTALSGLQSVADRIALEVSACPPAALALSDLASADAYTHRHSVQVAIVGLLVAGAEFRRNGWTDARGRRRFDRIEDRLALIGFGLLVHDIGKLAIPPEVLNKPGALDAAEWELVRAHPSTGAALLPDTSVSPLVRTVVRSHHERWDGQGYPDGKAGEAIHPFARIAAVADVFDAVTSERPYRGAAPPHVGVGVVADGAGTAFDPAIVASFRRVVMPYPVGHEVLLPDGRLAIVVSVDPACPDQPLVRVRDGRGYTDIQADLSGGVAA